MPWTPSEVVQHTLMQKRGGATRVADMLARALAVAGIPSRVRYEMAECAGAEPTAPHEAGKGLPTGALLHLHATSDWPGLLDSLPWELPLALTAHDAGLVTGGCPYPLDCPSFSKGCPDPCPRNFPSSRETREKRIAAIRSRAPVVVSPSGWLARILRPALADVTVKVVPNGVPWPEKMPDKAGARARWGLAPQAQAVLFVAHGGDMAAYKSGPRWMAIWERIKKAVPGSVGFMAGGDRAGREGDLTVTPYLPHEMLTGLMEACDLLVYPTLADNHPLVVLEAMSRGLPVVSYAVGGVPEQVQSGRTGLLVPAGDEQALVEAARHVLDSPALAKAMSRAAFDAGGRFGLERMVKAYQNVYDSAGRST